nr:MAG TPA: hypothetical protein [Caudoviricetes sp.]
MLPKVAQNPTSPTYQSGYFSLLSLTFLYSSKVIVSGNTLISFCVCFNSAIRYLLISLAYMLSHTILSAMFAPPQRVLSNYEYYYHQYKIE